MGAMVFFGIPPEEYWPYETAYFDKEPPDFYYDYAQNYQAILYARIDPPVTAKDQGHDRRRDPLHVWICGDQLY